MIKAAKIGVVIVLLFCLDINGFSKPFIRLDSISLANVEQIFQNGTSPESTLVTYKLLLINTDKLLTIENPTVTHKSILPQHLAE